MTRKLLAAPVLVVLALLVFGNSPTSAQTAAQSTTSQPAFSFEFLDISNNFAKLSNYPADTRVEIVVASQNADVRQVLPIYLQVMLNGSDFWTGTIPNNPVTNCRGADGCSVEGPVIPDTNQKVEISAKAQNNTLLTSYSQGATPEQEATQNSPTVTTTQSNTASDPDSSWFQRWWLFGFWAGLLWLFPWVFVGWQWARLRFWGFGWPWPWWFWIPLIWFIPWLIIAWVWWLNWWLWWFWIWWLFPWFFWLFWWLVVFKEAMIWLWRKSK